MIWAVLATVVAVLALVLALVVLVRAGRSRRTLQGLLDELDARAVALAHRVEELEQRPAHRPAGGADGTADGASYLITGIDDSALADGQDRDGRRVPDRVVLSATLGEPLVKTAALGHGLARALRPETRNRIWFQVRREVRRNRRQRRRDMKAAYRSMRRNGRVEPGMGEA